MLRVLVVVPVRFVREGIVAALDDASGIAEVVAVADVAAIMVHGQIQAVGRPADVEKELGAYLGVSA